MHISLRATKNNTHNIQLPEFFDFEGDDLSSSCDLFPS